MIEESTMRRSASFALMTVLFAAPAVLRADTIVVSGRLPLDAMLEAAIASSLSISGRTPQGFAHLPVTYESSVDPATLVGPSNLIVGRFYTLIQSHDQNVETNLPFRLSPGTGNFATPDFFLSSDTLSFSTHASQITSSPTPNVGVPEPSTFGLLGTGLAAMAVLSQRSRLMAKLSRHKEPQNTLA